MRIVFTKGKNPVSWAIRKMTGEPVSHVAFVLYDKIVMHQNFLGFQVEWLPRFEGHCHIVEEFSKELSWKETRQVYELLASLDGHGYDFGAMFGEFLAQFKHKVFKKPLPERNRLAKKNKLWCIELLEPLRDILDVPKEVRLDATTPHQMYLLLTREVK